MKIEDGGVYDVMVTLDGKGNALPHPLLHRGVLVRKRGELLVATNQAGDEVTPSMVMASLNRVPRSEGPIIGLRAHGHNAETFAAQSWILFPARMKDSA